MRIRVNASTSHRCDGVPVQYGPQTWPWWRLLSLSFLRLEVYRPTTGYRLWAYTRWGRCTAMSYLIDAGRQQHEPHSDRHHRRAHLVGRHVRCRLGLARRPRRGCHQRAEGRGRLGALAGEQAARSTEHRQAEALADIGAKHEEDRQAAQAVLDAVVADLRSGALKLRDGWASCETQRLTEASADATERDAAAARRDEFAGAVVRVGRDADDQLRACQAVVTADRGEPRDD